MHRLGNRTHRVLRMAIPPGSIGRLCISFLVASLLGCVLFLAFPVALFGQDDVLVLEKQLTLERKPLEPCAASAPPTLSGFIRLEINMSTGKVTGQIRGEGRGEDQAPLCDASGSPIAEMAEAIYSEMSYEGTISGQMDPASGEVDAQLVINVVGFLRAICPSGSTCVGPTYNEGIEYVTPQNATLDGVYRRDGQIQLTLDWYTGTCRRVTRTGPSTKESEFGRFCTTSWELDFSGPEWGGNRPPEIRSLTFDPPEPTSADTLVITVDASDPDGDRLTYEWVVDDEVQGATSQSVTWVEPAPGDHTVRVTVSDGHGEETAAYLDLRVSEHVGAKDRDDDGVPDDEDACPEEYGENPDGCPDFEAQIGCSPEQPEPQVQVICSVRVTGDRPGETLQYHWYLDSAFVETTTQASWTWDSATPGTHDVGVQVVGEGRSVDADGTIQVGELLDLVATIGLVPDPPVANMSVILASSVEGQRSDEALAYEWYLDGSYLCGDPNCRITDIFTGTYAVELYVYGDGPDRQAQAARTFSVAARKPSPSDPADLAGFAIQGLACDSDLTSDDRLSCTVRISREADLGVLDVVWSINGAVAYSESTLGNVASWSLALPAPGTHWIVVQVTDPESGFSQTAEQWLSVQMGANASIPPGTSAAAAVGTMTAIGAWLWGEWWLARSRERRDAALERDRQRWYDRISDLNAAERDARRRAEGYEYDAGEDVWKRPNGYVSPEERERQRIQDEMGRTRNAIDRLAGDLPQGDRDKIARMLDEIVTPGLPNAEDLDKLRRLKGAVFDKYQGHWGKIGADRQLDAIGWAEYETGARRVQMGAAVAGIGLLFAPGAAAAAAKLAVFNLGVNFFGGLAQGYSEGGWQQALYQAGRNVLPINTLISLQKGEGWLQTGFSALQDLGNAINLKLGVPRLAQWAKNTTLDDLANGVSERLRNLRRSGSPAVPVIHQRWGEAAVSYSPRLSSPPAPRPLTWVERMRNLEAMDRSMANRVSNLMGRSARFNMQRPPSLRPGQSMGLTADELAGHRLLQSPDYVHAVRSGLVPPRVVELTNHTRIKLTEMAVARAWDRLATQNPEAASRILRVDITGTGARPHSAGAIRGHTDIDLTVVADTAKRSGEGIRTTRAAAQAAEQEFVRLFNRELASGAHGVPGLAPRPGGGFVADINCFGGVHPSAAPAPGAYGSPELTAWVRQDNILRGQSIIRGTKGTTYFGAHPDVHPSPGYGTLDPAMHITADPARVIGDTRRVILEHIDDMPGVPTAVEIARAEGKHAWRAWWALHRGNLQQNPAPPEIQTLLRMKADRTWTPPPDELDAAVQFFWRMFDLPGRPQT